MKGLPRTVVVTISHGHGDLLTRYLPSLIEQRCVTPFDVVLIDNLAEPSVAELAAGLRLTYLANQNPMSFAANVNRAIARSPDYMYAVLWNPDVRAHAGVLDRLVAFMEAHSDVGIAAPRLLNPDGSIQSSARRFLSVPAMCLRALRAERWPFRVRAVERFLMVGEHQPIPYEVDWVTGAVMCVRLAAVKDVGLMDERFQPAYAEDQDWCCRMWQAGWRVLVVPEALATHDHRREAARRPFGPMGRALFLNAIRLLVKHRGQPVRDSPRGRSETLKGS